MSTQTGPKSLNLSWDFAPYYVIFLRLGVLVYTLKMKISPLLSCFEDYMS